MKKALSIGLAVVLVVAAVGVAMAWGPGGRGGTGSYGPGPGMMWGYDDGGVYSQADAEKYQKFQTDIAPLRDKMFQLRDEMFALRNAEKPDWDAIAAKQKEMVDIRTQIQKKAVEAGLSGPGYGPGARGGNGPCNCRGLSR